MPTFQELLAQLASEYERVESALANALAEPRIHPDQDVRAGQIASKTALRPQSPLRAASSGAPPLSPVPEECGAWDGSQWRSVDDDEGQVKRITEEQGEVCEAHQGLIPSLLEKNLNFGQEGRERSKESCSLATKTLPQLATCAVSDDVRRCKLAPGTATVLRQDTWQTYVTNSMEAVPSGNRQMDIVAPVERPRRLSGVLMEIAMPMITVRRNYRGSRWVIHPEHSRSLEKWDQVTMCALAYVALVTPVQVSMLQSKLDAMLVVNCFVDCIFLCDMVLQFFLMYPKRIQGVPSYEHRHTEIVYHYLKTWFPIDLFSMLPFDLFAALSDSQAAQQLKLVKTIRLMRLLKLLRVVKASRMFHRFETRTSISHGKMLLLKFFVILFVITHWLANLWALTLVIVDESEGLPRWVDALTALEDNVDVKTKDSPAKLYVACMYFTSYTITSVGYGDIGPKNLVERIILTVIIIGSGVSWAVVLGQVCGIIANLDRDEQAFRSTMDELNAMMQDRLIPPTMRTRLRSFFLSNKTAQKRLRHLQLVSQMSPGLRAEVSWMINRDWVNKINFLRPFVEEAEAHQTGIIRSLRPFVLEMSLMMEQAVQGQNEVFGVLHTMYILNRGLVGRLSRLLRSGAVWGTDFVLSEQRLLEPVESCALTYVELTTLSRQHFIDLVQRYTKSFPDIDIVVRRYCCWLAFQRALKLEALRRRALQVKQNRFLIESEGSGDVDGSREQR